LVYTLAIGGPRFVQPKLYTIRHNYPDLLSGLIITVRTP